MAPDGKLMAVPVQLAQHATLGAPLALFQTQMEGGGAPTGGIWHQYDASPNGQRFLVTTLTQPEGAQASAPITVVVNWDQGVKK